MPAKTDEQLRAELREIDHNGDIDVSSWEADFIESVCYKNTDRSLTAKQVSTIESILEKYRR